MLSHFVCKSDCKFFLPSQVATGCAFRKYNVDVSQFIAQEIPPKLGQKRPFFTKTWLEIGQDPCTLALCRVWTLSAPILTCRSVHTSTNLVISVLLRSLTCTASRYGWVEPSHMWGTSLSDDMVDYGWIETVKTLLPQFDAQGQACVNCGGKILS